MSSSITKAKLELEHQAQEAVNVIAEAAKNAARVIAAAAAEAVKVQTMQNSKSENDHDLIVQLGVKVDQLVIDVKDLKDNTSRRVDFLESEKVGKETFDKNKVAVDEIQKDHETRIRRSEVINVRLMTWGSAAMVALAVVQFLIGKFA